MVGSGLHHDFRHPYRWPEILGQIARAQRVGFASVRTGGHGQTMRRRPEAGLAPWVVALTDVGPVVDVHGWKRFPGEPVGGTSARLQSRSTEVLPHR